MLVSEALGLLRSIHSPEGDRLAARFDDLAALAAAVSRFPRIGSAQSLGNVHRGPDTLEALLCGKCGGSRLLHTPSRVVLGRSFLIAKIHALSFASIAVASDADLAARLRDRILAIVFTLLAEDVYAAGLADADCTAERKAALASDLVKLWDDRRDPRAGAYIPALAELWAARDGHTPVFGTMEGASELARLSFDMGYSWFSFVSERLRDEQTLLALEEYLFGLSYEEIVWIRSRMASRNLHCADSHEIRTLLGAKRAYSNVDGRDPRGMYEFYVERRDAARSRAWAGVPGPQRTLEELYLSYLIAR